MIINNQDEKEGNYEKLLTKLNKSLFYFTTREYYSNKINIFTALKLLSKIIYSDKSNKLQTKCASLFFNILSKKSLLESDPKQEKITPIINDMKTILLLSKNNYPIIIENAIYLVQTNNIDKAISTLQYFSNQSSFINCGEILFYKALIEYFLNSTQEEHDKNIFISNLDKSLCLIKNNPEPYYHWALDFLIQKKMYFQIKEKFLKTGYMTDFLAQKKNENKIKYLNLILKTNYGRENNEYINYTGENNEFYGIYHYNNNSDTFNNISIVDEENDIKQKIKDFSEFLEISPFNFDIVIQIHDLIENYFCDDVIITKKNIDLNNYNLFLKKIIYFGENIFIKYLNFVMYYYTFNFTSNFDSFSFNNESFNKLKEILENINYVINNVDNNCFLKNNDNLIKMQNDIIEFYKNIIFEILKKKISKKIKKHIFMIKKNKDKENNIKLIKDEIGRLFLIINICKEIITGEKLIDINDKFYSSLLTKEFLIYIQNLK